MIILITLGLLSLDESTLITAISTCEGYHFDTSEVTQVYWGHQGYIKYIRAIGALVYNNPNNPKISPNDPVPGPASAPVGKESHQGSDAAAL